MYFLLSIQKLQLLLNYIKGEILYNKTRIGELSFSPFDDNNVDSKTISNSDTTEKGKLIEIKGKKDKVIPIYFRFFNCEIPRIWEHQLKNKTGELSVKLILTFKDLYFLLINFEILCFLILS